MDRILSMCSIIEIGVHVSGCEMGDENQHLPKYIKSVPWYYKGRVGQDTLAHNRSNPEKAVDYSAQAGTGIDDEYTEVDGVKVRTTQGYDAQRDRWHGYSAEEWDEILRKWDKIKKAKQPAHEPSDSDDTEYELELHELGLERKDLKVNFIEDPLEKTIRDRRDVPKYILAINANANGLRRIGKDSLGGIVADDSDFVKQSSDSAEFRRVQLFAWDQSKKHEEQRARDLYEAQFTGQMPQGPAVDLDLSVEASPTLVQLKSKQADSVKRKQAELKKQALLAKYGSASTAS